MAKLSDTQSILLSTASQRENGSLLPLPASIKLSGGTAKAMSALLKRALTEERETSDADAVHRTDGDVRYGVFLTAAGAGAIGVEPGGSANSAAGDAAVSDAATSAPPTTAVPASKRPTKAAAVLALLTRPTGATLSELIQATGWLPHTTRAALTGLRKKGHDIARSKRNGTTCYRITEQA